MAGTRSDGASASPTRGRRVTPEGVTLVWEIAAPTASSEPSKPQDRAARRLVSRRLLHAELAETLAAGSTLVRQCANCGSGEHGRLRVEPALSSAEQPSAAATPPSTGSAASPLISVSYAGPLTVVGIAPPGSRWFGIDVEWDTPERQRAAREALGAPEDGRDPDHPLREWTRLEAIAKVRGRGLHGDWAQPDTAGLTCTRVTLEFGSHADGPDPSPDPGANPSAHSRAILSIALG